MSGRKREPVCVECGRRHAGIECERQSVPEQLRKAVAPIGEFYAGSRRRRRRRR